MSALLSPASRCFRPGGGCDPPPAERRQKGAEHSSPDLRQFFHPYSPRSSHSQLPAKVCATVRSGRTLSRQTGKMPSSGIRRDRLQIITAPASCIWRSASLPPAAETGRVAALISFTGKPSRNASSTEARTQTSSANPPTHRFVTLSRCS